MPPSALALFLRSLPGSDLPEDWMERQKSIYHLVHVDPARLNDHLQVAQALVGSVEHPSQAQESLGWLLLRFPNEHGLSRVQRLDTSLPLEGRMQALIDALLAKGACLQHPWQASDKAVLLGRALIGLGHGLYGQVVDEVERGEAARTLAAGGRFQECMELLSQMDNADEMLAQIWHDQNQWLFNPQQPPELLTDPPARWWDEIQRIKHCASTPKAAHYLVHQRPYLQPLYLKSVLEEGELDTVDPALFKSCIRNYPQFQAAAGWNGSPLLLWIDRYMREGSLAQLQTELSGHLPLLHFPHESNAQDGAWLQVVEMATKGETLSSSGLDLLNHLWNSLPLSTEGAPPQGLVKLLYKALNVDLPTLHKTSLSWLRSTQWVKQVEQGHALATPAFLSHAQAVLPLVDEQLLAKPGRRDVDEMVEMGLWTLMLLKCKALHTSASSPPSKRFQSRRNEVLALLEEGHFAPWSIQTTRNVRNFMASLGMEENRALLGFLDYRILQETPNSPHRQKPRL